MRTKFIFMAGGVMSGVGKGVATAALGRLLKSYGYRVSAMKIDPYINVDAGTMNPTEHGEVFVTEDGDETDQDIGNYERFLDENILSTNYMTTGRVYLSVIERERNLAYGGRCVEVVPDIPNEVIDRVKKAAQKSRADFFIVEIGGTVGEYQNILFLEAVRSMQLKDPASVALVLVSYLPVPQHIGEMKTKPTQYAARTLNSAGLNADFIVARSSQPLDVPRKHKLAIFCGIPADHVISAPNVPSIYEIPVLFKREQFAEKLFRKFGLRARKSVLREWESLVRTITHTKKEIHIGIIGKYFLTGKFTLPDSYHSVIEAVKHGAWATGRKPVIDWLNSEEYEEDARKLSELDQYDGVIVPGGFGSRGIEGKILAIEYVRRKKIPYFGLCYGMQLATVEFARNVAGLKDAHTVEVNPKTPHPIITANPEQIQNMYKRKFGGTMRLGAYPCVLGHGSLAARAYGTRKITERHRHRYELNNVYRARLEKAGLKISGNYLPKNLAEIIEIPEHPFFVGVQFHPEFKSRPLAPHPLFKAFMEAAVKRQTKRR
ncbi:CTP synthase [Candidatus Uhrbacteria bacterium]|nr:CTP synthase [Candidatus Uhrbacteria bacterium]